MSCSRCNRLLKSQKISIVNDQVLIGIENSEAIDFVNLRRYCLLLAQPLPPGSNSLPVKLVIDDEIIDVFTVTGNYLRADQLDCRRIFPVIYGTNPIHFSLVHCIKNTTNNEEQEGKSSCYTKGLANE